MEWYHAIEQIKDHTVKVITPQGHGTGFFIAPDNNMKLQGIATAAHVVHYAHYWQQPIRIQHAGTRKEVFLKKEERFIDMDLKHDTASVIFSSQNVDLGFPSAILPFIKEGSHYKVGVDIGWIGFPAISPDHLCFFNGRISCWLEDEGYYLVDGVAINGVSGGPAFAISKNEVQFMGLVSSYIPNQATGISMPGLCVIRDVSHARKSAQLVKDLGEESKKATIEQLPQPSAPSNSETIT